MNIGLIADIHSDKSSLDCALDLLRHQLGVDTIICAGDLAEKGPDGDAVIRHFQAEAIPCVRGNHDYAVVENQAWLRANGDPASPALRARLIADESLSFLETLPKTLRFEWEAHSVFMAHGAPWNTSLYIFPTSRPKRFVDAIRYTAADFVVLGHTHQPMEIHVDTGEVRGHVLNPGSVCGPLSSGSHTCGVLSLPKGDFTVYDLKTGQAVPHFEFTIRAEH